MSTTPNSDYKDLLSAFNAAGVEYVIVGAHAVAAYGFSRYTKDFDVLVRPSAENADRVYRALIAFGAPLDKISPADFTNRDVVFQMGVEPVRIDVITEIDGVGFDEIWEHRIQSSYAGIPMSVIGREQLLRNKRASGRPHDLADVEALEKIGDLH